MPPVSENLPAETDLLCESCGYVLNGLPDSGLCPECGASIRESTTASPRTPPEWELAEHAGIGAFVRTTRQVLFRPGMFYRYMTTRSDSLRSRAFARWHYLIAASLLAIAVTSHLVWFANFAFPVERRTVQITLVALLPVTAAVIYAALVLVTRLASFLTSIEAKYWGFRLPRNVVRRGLDYHAAHYVPVAVAGAAVIVGYRVLLGWGVLDERSTVPYLYVLSALVVVSAGYLFYTYVIAMKRTMFANR